MALFCPPRCTIIVNYCLPTDTNLSEFFFEKGPLLKIDGPYFDGMNMKVVTADRAS